MTRQLKRKTSCPPVSPLHACTACTAPPHLYRMYRPSTPVLPLLACTAPPPQLLTYTSANLGSLLFCFGSKQMALRKTLASPYHTCFTDIYLPIAAGRSSVVAYLHTSIHPTKKVLQTKPYPPLPPTPQQPASPPFHPSHSVHK